MPASSPSYVQRLLLRYDGFFFVTWCLIASFGAYFCMYAFRKPFATGLFAGMQLWGFDYKVILIISQVFGYMLSKFMGIRVIGGLRPAQRIRLIIGLILFAEAALLALGVVPYPYNFVCMFLNGLPLGMIWGIVFSFLEGRRFTEVLSFGLSLSLITSSGILKTIYLQLHEWMAWIPEFWMPFTMGLVFLPLFCLFVWMLSVIPAPTEEDKRLRTERIPMTREIKRDAMRQFGLGLVCVVIVYSLLTMMRDFRDNFSVEIWNDIAPNWDKSVLASTELMVGIIVLTLVGCISLIKRNTYGFWVTQSLMALGVVGCFVSSFLYQAGCINPYIWMLTLGIGLFMAYIPIQSVLFERMLAMYHFRANAGFFVYICDSFGYLGSVGLLLYKEFFMRSLHWSVVLIRFSYTLAFTSVVLLFIAAVFFNRRYANNLCAQKAEEMALEKGHEQLA